MLDVAEELQGAHTDEDNNNVSHVRIHNGFGTYSRFKCIILGGVVGLGIGYWAWEAIVGSGTNIGLRTSDFASCMAATCIDLHFRLGLSVYDAGLSSRIVMLCAK